MSTSIVAPSGQVGSKTGENAAPPSIELEWINLTDVKAPFQSSVVGYQSLLYNFTGVKNTVFGYQASYHDNSVSGNNNVIMGTFAGYRNSSDENVYIGASAAYNLAAGGQNTYVGHRSGGDSGTGGHNTYLGWKSGGDAGGRSNTYVGHNAGNGVLTSTSENVSLGQGSLASGGRSTAVGTLARVAGARSVGLGYNDSVEDNDTVVIGNNIVSTAARSLIIHPRTDGNPYTFSNDETLNIYGVVRGQRDVGGNYNVSLESDKICLDNGVNRVSLQASGLEFYSDASAAFFTPVCATMGLKVIGGVTRFDTAATFDSAATFNGAVAFNSPAAFDDLTIKTIAVSDQARFRGKSYFEDAACFGGAVSFSGDVYFDDRVFFPESVAMCNLSLSGDLEMGGSLAVVELEAKKFRARDLAVFESNVVFAGDTTAVTFTATRGDFDQLFANDMHAAGMRVDCLTVTDKLVLPPSLSQQDSHVRSDLAVDGFFRAGCNALVEGWVDLRGELDVHGVSSFASTVLFGSNVIFGNDVEFEDVTVRRLDVSEKATFNEAAVFGDKVVFSDDVKFCGGIDLPEDTSVANLRVTDRLELDGKMAFGGDVEVGAAMRCAGPATFGCNAAFGGPVEFAGEVGFSDRVSFGGEVLLPGTVEVTNLLVGSASACNAFGVQSVMGAAAVSCMDVRGCAHFHAPAEFAEEAVFQAGASFVGSLATNDVTVSGAAFLSDVEVAGDLVLRGGLGLDAVSAGSLQVSGESAFSNVAVFKELAVFEKDVHFATLAVGDAVSSVFSPQACAAPVARCPDDRGFCLEVRGSADFHNGIDVLGASMFFGEARFDAPAVFSDSVEVFSAEVRELLVQGASEFEGAVSFQKGAVFSSNAIFEGALEASAEAVFREHVAFSNAVTFLDEIHVPDGFTVCNIVVEESFESYGDFYASNAVVGGITAEGRAEFLDRSHFAGEVTFGDRVFFPRECSLCNAEADAIGTRNLRVTGLATFESNAVFAGQTTAVSITADVGDFNVLYGNDARLHAAEISCLTVTDRLMLPASLSEADSHVRADLAVDGFFRAASNAMVEGRVDVRGGLDVHGNAKFCGPVELGASATINGVPLGNLVGGGCCESVSLVQLSSRELEVSGNALFGGDVNVAGCLGSYKGDFETLLVGGVDVLEALSNLAIRGIGNDDWSDHIYANNVTVSNEVRAHTVTAAECVSAEGNAVIHGDLFVFGNIVQGNFFACGSGPFDITAPTKSGYYINDRAVFNYDVLMKANLTVSQDAVFAGCFNATGDAVFSGRFTATETATLTDGLVVHGPATFNGAVALNGPVGDLDAGAVVVRGKASAGCLEVEGNASVGGGLCVEGCLGAKAGDFANLRAGCLEVDTLVVSGAHAPPSDGLLAALSNFDFGALGSNMSFSEVEVKALVATECLESQKDVVVQGDLYVHGNILHGSSNPFDAGGAVKRGYYVNDKITFNHCSLFLDHVTFDACVTATRETVLASLTTTGPSVFTGLAEFTGGIESSGPSSFDDVAVRGAAAVDGDMCVEGKIKGEAGLEVRGRAAFSGSVEAEGTVRAGGCVRLDNPGDPAGLSHWRVCAAETDQDGHLADLRFTSWKGTTVTFTEEFVPSVLNFTGSHRCSYGADLVDWRANVGKIVVSMGHYEDLYGSSGVTVDDAVPVVGLSCERMDPRVFGVVSEQSDTVNKRRKFCVGNLSFDQETNDTKKVVVNSCGEGAVWVCRENGDLRNGDLICTSSSHGLGCRQGDDIVRSYTVAKITQDCVFEEGEPERLVGCVYLC